MKLFSSLLSPTNTIRSMADSANSHRDPCQLIIAKKVNKRMLFRRFWFNVWTIKRQYWVWTAAGASRCAKTAACYVCYYRDFSTPIVYNYWKYTLFAKKIAVLQIGTNGDHLWFGVQSCNMIHWVVSVCRAKLKSDASFWVICKKIY